MNTPQKNGEKKSSRLFFLLSNTLLIAVLTAVYFVAGKAGLSLAFTNASATAVWPATGLFLAAMLLLGYRVGAAIFLGAFLVNWTTTGGIATSLGIAAGNMLESLAAAFLIKRYACGAGFTETSACIFKFFTAAIGSTFLSALIGTATLLAGGLARLEDLWPVGFTWWLGDLVSAVILTPFIIIWADPPRARFKWKTAAEIAALLVSVFAVVGTVFGAGVYGEGTSYPLEYLGIPLLLWAVFRFGRHGATGISFLMCAITLYQTLRGRGPFAVAEPNASLLLLQSFMAVISGMGLAVAAVLLEQKKFQEERSHFVSSVSHELRTPLGVIKSGLDVIAQEDVPVTEEQKKEFLDVARKNVDRLAKLVNDILDFQKLRSESFALDFEECSLAEILEETARMTQVLADQKRIAFSVNIDEDLPRISADKNRLIQVWFNVLDNAIKFTDKGSVSLVAQKRPGGIYILITDSGHGIEPQDMNKLFKPFSQIRNPKNRKIGGTGLGLVISKKIIEQHGGELGLESQPGKGTRVSIFLPFNGRPQKRSF